ncbi:hypothetical protein B0T26DRAFT_679263 [Lasiosphaeria miniovina]|uniref:Uncharacterized protein n=1 Tax=Lasiosphaeria miniovina TaxID=1954250 RepID=A0AA40DNP8_9PEZI|nr:uncharacterized protein B0T26DRAFT_679263 [Lasiosphaeria miniovina]KAK0709910.1 hypothetical protein B0T26DRAFT_679263 [Lasiosphaeria miniovina]
MAIEGAAKPASDDSSATGSSDSHSTRKPYVNLGDTFHKSSIWSNDPNDMQLELYFSSKPNKNLTMDEVVEKVSTGRYDYTELEYQSGAFQDSELWSSGARDRSGRAVTRTRDHGTTEPLLLVT